MKISADSGPIQKSHPSMSDDACISKTKKNPFKRKACQVYRVGYGRGRIW